MLSILDYEDLDAVAIAHGIRSHDFTATEVMECALEKAHSLNPGLNAISWQTYDQALDQARHVDQTLDEIDAPLAGVPFLYKDISAVKGLPQTNQCRLFQDEIATGSAIIIDSFAEAGLISLGKSNTPEFCLTLTTESVLGGKCHNPWSTNHSAGGSSGGAAAAVAARIVPVAHATDGGGSIRVPASCCGLVGLKPSRGLTPVEPKLAASWSGMSVGHVVTRSVRDSAAVLDAIKLKQPFLYALPEAPESFMDQLGHIPKLRLGVQRAHPLGAHIHPEVCRSLDIAVELCRQMGFEVVEAAPPIDYKLLVECTSMIINTHVAQKVMPQLEKLELTLETELLEEGTRRMAKRGAESAAMDLVMALDILKGIAMEMNSFHEHYDVLISPVLTQPPAPLGWLDMNSKDIKSYAKKFSSYSGYCSLYNATGQPSLSVPLHQTGDGLPVGVMFSAKWGADLQLLQLANQMQQELDWNKRKPPVC